MEIGMGSYIPQLKIKGVLKKKEYQKGIIKVITTLYSHASLLLLKPTTLIYFSLTIFNLIYKCAFHVCVRD